MLSQGEELGIEERAGRLQTTTTSKGPSLLAYLERHLIVEKLKCSQSSRKKSILLFTPTCKQ